MINNLYIPFHPGDYLTDTAHLTVAEHGAYFLLILNYWQRGEPLPNDDRKLRGIARMTADEWAESRETILEFFDEQDGYLHHGRIDVELEKALERSEAAREAGKRSAAKRSSNKRSTPVEPALSKGSTNQDQDQEQEEAIASSADEAKILTPEIKRRLEQATGWLGIPGEGAIQTLISEGHSFEDRILPLAKDEAARRSDAPKSWTYLAAVVRDQTRKPTAAAKPVEVAWVPTSSPVWKRLCAVKPESLLRQMVKPGPGGDGLYWPVADLPPRAAAAA